MTAHFPGLLQALYIHDRSFPWLATALHIHDRSFPWLAIVTSNT